jgi:hypothetical protein
VVIAWRDRGITEIDKGLKRETHRAVEQAAPKVFRRTCFQFPANPAFF